MANWSSTSINLSGEKRDIQNAYNDLRKIIKDGWLSTLQFAKSDSIEDRAGYGGATVVDLNMDTENNELQIILEGRWCSPHSYFIDLCKKHSLSGTYTDEEQGCDFFHLIEFKDGEVLRDEEQSFFSDLSVEHNGIFFFLDEYEFITEADNWEEENKAMLDMFAKYGWSLESVKEYWGI